MTKQMKFTIGSFKEYVKANRRASRNEGKCRARKA